MKEITEDYVSYEIAQLLKEKGFDVPTENFYDTTGENLKDSKTIYGGIPDFGEVNWNADPFVCEGFPKLITFSKPSQSLALKWLREVHNVFISSDLDVYSNLYFATVYTQLQCTTPNKHYSTELYINPKQAVEAAILYVLKNLI